ncbi:Transposable element Tc1 transposase, partial [Stegodyphus mimosarum]
MPRRRKRARFEQLTEFERGRIIGLREAGLSYRAVASRVQRNSSTVMRVWKQWTDECRTTRKSGSGPRNVTSARDDRHLVRMARTDRTASSRQLAALWSIATGVSLCASSIRRRLLQCGLRARTPLYRIPLTHDHRRLRLQWANQHRDWRADWQHVVFSDESRFNLWYHDGRIRVRRYAGERHLPECIIERHSGRTPGVMVWGAIAYHRRSQLLRIVGNLNSNRYIREVLQPEAVPFLQSLPGAVFQQDNARPHTARIVKSFFAAQQVQLLPWPACSPDMSPIEHVWDVIGRRLARDPRPVASADELWNIKEAAKEIMTLKEKYSLWCFCGWYLAASWPYIPEWLSVCLSIDTALKLNSGLHSKSMKKIEASFSGEIATYSALEVAVFNKRENVI